MSSIPFPSESCRETGRRWALRWAAFLALASVLRWLFGGMSEGFGPMTFLPAILLAGLFGGIRIGMAFALVSTIIGWTLFFPPYGTFMLATPHRISMLVFIVTASLELYVIWSLNLAMHAARQSQRAVEHAVPRAAAPGRKQPSVRVRAFVAPKEIAGARGARRPGARRRARPASDDVARAPPAARPEISDAPVDQYLTALCTDLIHASDTPDVRLIVEADPVVLDLEALMSVSLIVAELVTNSLKHAFKGRADGEIT